MSFDIAELRELLAAATGVGRWHWSGDTDAKRVYLATWMSGHGRVTVMDFGRWGMQSAQPLFNEDMMLTKAADLVTYEVGKRGLVGRTGRSHPSVYRGDIDGIRHPDAELIVAAVNSLPELLDRLEAAEDALERARALVANGGDYHYTLVGDPEGDYVMSWSPCVSVDDLLAALGGGESDD